MRKIIALLAALCLLLPYSVAGAESADTPELTSFTTVDLDGNPVDLSLMNGASVILLHFWEPWTSSCRTEIPGINAVYEKYRDQGVLIIGVSGMMFSEFPEDSRAISEELGVSYPLVQWQDDLLPFRFEPEGFPTTMVLTREEDGSVVISMIVHGSMTESEWEYLIVQRLPGSTEVQA